MRSGSPDGADARRLVAAILTCPGLHRTVLVVISGVRGCCDADSGANRIHAYHVDGLLARVVDKGSDGRGTFGLVNSQPGRDTRGGPVVSKLEILHSQGVG